ncbi:MAG: hypothetical protein KFF77_09490 [Bacteroidetes bacterium]|nr:hypothetical protein [Bacteroidota bacterium]
MFEDVRAANGTGVSQRPAYRDQRHIATSVMTRWPPPIESVPMTLESRP